MFKEYRKYKLFLMLFDVVLTVVTFAVMVKLRPYLPGREITPEEVLPTQGIYPFVALLWHSVFALSGVYNVRTINSFSQQFPRFTTGFFFASLAFAGLLYFTFREVSRMLTLTFLAANFALLLAGRLSMAWYMRSAWSGLKPISVLVVGVSDSGIAMANRIIAHHRAVLRVAGFVDRKDLVKQIPPAPLLGDIDDLPRLIREQDIGQVVIALPENRGEETEQLLHKLESLPVRVYLVPDTTKLSLIQAEVESYGDLVVIGIREPIIQGHRRITKRIMDIIICTGVLLVSWPLFLVIWILIKLDSAGPVVFVTERVGENGKIFRMYKFRTMITGAEKLQDQVVTTDEQGRTVYKQKADPRVTRIGKYLRASSLDELPQLFNIFKGEMSLVGPRPEQPFITAHYDHWQWQRFSVPPGITGWWQVSGRSDLPMHLNTQYDIYYVRNYNLILDFRILMKTVGVVLRGKGAY